RAGLPELPVDRRRRWVRDRGLSFEDAEVLSETPALAQWFEEAAAASGDAKAAANWIRGDLRALLRERGEEPWESAVTPASLASLLGLLGSGRISTRVAKDVLAQMVETGADPQRIVEEQGLDQMGGGDELAAIVERILADHPDQAQQLRDGKEKV